MTLTNLSRLYQRCYICQANVNIYYPQIRLLSNAESEYTDTAIYPPIEDVSPITLWRKKKTDWHKKIEKLPTIEQKLVEMNMPKYYGYSSTLLMNKTIRRNSLEFIKFLTRTKIIPTLPRYYDDEMTIVEDAVNSIKDQVADLIVDHYGNHIIR